jgi:hypothetical protein
MRVMKRPLVVFGEEDGASRALETVDLARAGHVGRLPLPRGRGRSA